MAAADSTTPVPRVVTDLSTDQLRHLLLAKLPPSVGVDAWGATRAELLEMESRWRGDVERLAEEKRVAAAAHAAEAAALRAERAHAVSELEHELRRERGEHARLEQRLEAVEASGKAAVERLKAELGEVLGSAAMTEQQLLDAIHQLQVRRRSEPRGRP